MFFSLLMIVLTLVPLVAIYRLYLHPLAKFPGPLIGRITDWYSVFHCLKGDRYLDFIDLHNRYGDVVRFGPNRLSFSSADALQAIYGSRANTTKSSQYKAMAFYMKEASTHATIEKAQHARKRRILAQALSDRMVHVYEDGFRTLLTKFLRRYENSDSKDEGWSPAFDMAHEFVLLNYDSMGEFCFGESFGALEDPKKADITESTLSGFRGVSASGYVPALRYLKLDVLASGTRKAIKEYEAHSAALAKRRIETMDERTNKNKQLSCVFDILYATSENPGVEGFTLSELRSESSLLVTTGTDTIAGSMANVLFHLLNSPETLRSLTTEIRSNFSDVSEIRIGQTLNNCKYLAACIDESLRLTSSVGGILIREVGIGGITIDGQFIPSGVDVGVPQHVVMRNPRYFDAPLEYRPQRWLPTEASAGEIKDSRSAFCPFLMGPTGCPGKFWALVEMKITIAQLVFQYDLKDGTSGDGITSVSQRLHERDRNGLDRFVITNKGPWVKFRLANVT